MTLAAALGLHEGDCPDPAAMRSRGRLRGAAVAVGVGPALVACVVSVLMLFALLLCRA